MLQSTSLLILMACAAEPNPARPTLGNPMLQEQSLADVFEGVQSSVVTIQTKRSFSLLTNNGQVTTQEGIGSGVLITEDTILTAAHVIQTADELVVTFMDGSHVPAKIVGSVPDADVALIQLTAPRPERMKPSRLADSDPVRIGSRVFVVGSPRGISQTLSVGHVSARRASAGRFAGIRPLEVFQTDAAINKGNSGGPMFNMHGEVIGIVSYIVSESGGSEGIGFAVTSNVARALLIDRSPFWSGLAAIAISGPMAEALNFPGGRPGYLVQDVAEESPAGRLGLKGGAFPVTIEGQTILLGGDVILDVLGVSVDAPDSQERIWAAVDALQPGDDLVVVILRGGKDVELRKPFGELVAEK